MQTHNPHAVVKHMISHPRSLVTIPKKNARSLTSFFPSPFLFSSLSVSNIKTLFPSFFSSLYIRALNVDRFEEIFAVRKVHTQDVTGLLDLARGIEEERRKVEVIDGTGLKNGKMESHNLHGTATAGDQRRVVFEVL